MSEVQTETSAFLHSSIEYQSVSDIGMRRKENQDRSSFVERPDFKVFIVADGMGGAKGGAQAAQVAVDTISKHFHSAEHVDADLIFKSILSANKEIFQDSIADPELTGMGTTVVMLVITADRVFIANVGDSRAYKIRQGKSLQLTEDHTLVTELLKAGLIDEEQAGDHPVAHMLTRSLGPAVKVEVDCFLDSPGPITDDTYLLCSDGLYNLVSDQEIGEIVSQNSLDIALEKLVNLANSRGGTDNITIYLVKVKNWEGREEIAPLEIKTNKSLVPHNSLKINNGEEAFEKVLLRYKESNPLKQMTKDVDGNFRFFKSLWFTSGLFVIILFLAWQYYAVQQKNILSTRQIKTMTKKSLAKPLRAKSQSVDAGKVYAKYLQAIKVGTLTDLLANQSKLEEKYVELTEQYSANSKILNELNKKLSLWYGRKEQFEMEGAMSLANEIAEISGEIAEKQQVFQEISWEYLQELEILRKNSQDEQRKENVSSLLQKRKNAMKEMELGIYSVIQEKIDKINKDIADLIVQNSEFSEQLDLMEAELKILHMAEGKTKEELLGELHGMMAG